MTLVGLVVTLIVIGVALYLVQLIPMDAVFKQIIRVVVILVALLYVLSAFGFISGLPLR